MMKLFDVVALIHDVPAKGLSQGQVGTVVENLGSGTFEVEFADRDGHAYALAPLTKEDVMTLHHAVAGGCIEAVILEAGVESRLS